MRPPTSPLCRNRGSVLIVALLFSGLIGISLVSYIQLATVTLRTAERSFYANNSINYAEIGIERAMACFYAVTAGTAADTAFDSATWTKTGSNATARFPGPTTTFPAGPGATAVVRVFVQNYNYTGTPKIVARATITPNTGRPIEKYIEVTLASRSLFTNGLVARDNVTWVGHPTADSWNSVVNPAYSVAVRAANCTIGAANGSISLGSGGNVYGRAATGPSGTTSGGSVHGLVLTDTAGRITNDFTASLPAVVTPAPVTYINVPSGTGGSVPTDFPRAADVANVNASDGRYYYVFESGSAISATTTIGNAVPNKRVTFIMNNHAPIDAITFTGTKSLTVKTGSALTVYTNGGIKATGNGMVNGNTAGANSTAALQIYGTNTTPGGQTIKIGGNGQLYAAVYAPNAAVELKGGGSSGMVLGSIVARTIDMNGGTDFHYDEALANLGAGAGVRVSRWKELQSAPERALYPQLNFD